MPAVTWRSRERLIGLFCLVLAAALYLLVIPAQTEVENSGWLRPQTLPNLAAWLIALCGAAMLLVPGHQPPAPHAPTLARAAVNLALLLAGVALMSAVGFIWAAPAIALAIMLMIGERRLPWLALGALGMPLLIWFAVAVLLDRPLP